MLLSSFEATFEGCESHLLVGIYEPTFEGCEPHFFLPSGKTFLEDSGINFQLAIGVAVLEDCESPFFRLASGVPPLVGLEFCVVDGLLRAIPILRHRKVHH